MTQEQQRKLEAYERIKAELMQIAGTRVELGPQTGILREFAKALLEEMP